MKSLVLPGAVFGSLLLAGAAQAAGIDRSGQGIGLIFEEGTYFELSIGGAFPTVSGVDTLLGATGDVTLDYALPAGGAKFDVTDDVSLGLVVDTPFGADILYAPTSTMLGGTAADLNSLSAAGIARYEFNENFSVHGGVRVQSFGGYLETGGLAYGALNGYNVTLADGLAFGYLVGGAFEMPEAGLKVVVTYNSAITHSLASEERSGAVIVLTDRTSVTTPQSINVDAQIDITTDTRLFGGFRWVDWSAFEMVPPFFDTITTGAQFVDTPDAFTFTVGVGHEFDETWSGTFAVQYEPANADALVWPLTPVNGSLGATAAVTHTQDMFKVTGSLGYTKFGDASPETGTPDGARADMSGGSFTAGLKLGFSL